MTITSELRRAILASGRTLYRVAKDAGIEYSIVHRFVHGAGVKGETVDALAKSLGLELRPKDQAQPAKRRK